MLTTAARGIAEIITMTGKVNVDFEDVKTVMTESGVAIMGMAEAEGEERALRAAQEALASPLLNDNDIRGAKFVLLNITHGTQEVLMDEITQITDHIQDAAGSSADVIWGYCRDESLGEKVRVTVIATGFHVNPETGQVEEPTPERRVIPLDADVPTISTRPIASPVAMDRPTATEPEEAPVEAPLEPYPQADGRDAAGAHCGARGEHPAAGLGAASDPGEGARPLHRGGEHAAGAAGNGTRTTRGVGAAPGRSRAPRPRGGATFEDA